MHLDTFGNSALKTEKHTFFVVQIENMHYYNFIFFKQECSGEHKAVV